MIDVNNLMSVSQDTWNQLFALAESAGRQSFESDVEAHNHATYEFIGELDNPMEALDFGASMDDVRRTGGRKLNWFRRSDGTFLACDDYEAESIFESGSCAKFEWQEDSDEDDDLEYEAWLEKHGFI